MTHIPRDLGEEAAAQKDLVDAQNMFPSGSTRARKRHVSMLKAMLNLRAVQRDRTSIQDDYLGILIQVDYSTATTHDIWWSLPRDRTNAILNQLFHHTSHSVTVNYRWTYPSPDGYGEDAPWEWTSYYSLDFESMIQQNVETGNVRRFRVMLAL